MEVRRPERVLDRQSRANTRIKYTLQTRKLFYHWISRRWTRGAFWFSKDQLRPLSLIYVSSLWWGPRVTTIPFLVVCLRISLPEVSLQLSSSFPLQYSSSSLPRRPPHSSVPCALPHLHRHPRYPTPIMSLTYECFSWIPERNTYQCLGDSIFYHVLEWLQRVIFQSQIVLESFTDGPWC